MASVKVGQTVRVNVAVWDFCGELGNNGLFISDVGIDTIPALDSDVRCLDITGLAIEFRLVTSGDTRCKGCNPEIVYSTWGTAYTDSRGYAYIDHTISEDDLAAYQAAISSGASVKVLACITGAKGQQIISHRCSASITITPALPPTHYISLSMGFVPPELVTYFETYISAISDNLMTKMAPPPSPWVYMKTTYDRITNSFNIWLYLPPTAVLSMSPGAMQDIYDFIAAWAPLVTGILLILIAAFGPFGLFADLVLLFAGLVILGWKVVDATSKQLLAETKTNNLNIQLEQNNKEDQARSTTEDAWTKSAKTQADCLSRLQIHRDVHLSKLNGYIDQYAKYPGLVTELSTERDTFTANANSIIAEFKTVSYTGSTCDTYFVRLNSEIGGSNVAINDSLGRYIKLDETYSVACKGWTNQAACEKAECFWYDGACHKEEACWIPNPVGGCVLSARTGMIIVGTVTLLGIIGIGYWVATRHPGEARAIITGAREAAREEAARVRAAYQTIAPPRIPGTVPGYAAG